MSMKHWRNDTAGWNTKMIMLGGTPKWYCWVEHQNDTAGWNTKTLRHKPVLVL